MEIKQGQILVEKVARAKESVEEISEDLPYAQMTNVTAKVEKTVLNATKVADLPNV